jgi:hypothetical protein
MMLHGEDAYMFLMSRIKRKLCLLWNDKAKASLFIWFVSCFDDFMMMILLQQNKKSRAEDKKCHCLAFLFSL